MIYSPNLASPAYVDVKYFVDRPASEDILTYQRTYLDGLGRQVQTQTVKAKIDNLAFKNIVVDSWYDAYGRLKEQTVPYAKDYLNAPSAYGRSDTAARTRNAYDLLGRLASTTLPDNTQTTYNYAIVNVAELGGTQLETRTTDARGLLTIQFQDAYGRLRRVTPPQTSLKVTYHYDVLGHLTDVYQPGNYHTEIKYDQGGRKYEMDDPDMGLWTYTYDATGNLLTQTDSKGQTIWMKYDELNRLIEKRVGGPTGTLLASFSYDAFTTGSNYGKGRRTGMEDASGETTWTYDARGRVSRETRTLNNGLGTYTVSYLYNSADLVKQITYPDGEVVNLEYDTRQFLTKLGNTADLDVNNPKYDVYGRLTQLNLTAAIQPVYTYNAPTTDGGRLSRIRVGTDLDLSYDYDALGNITTITDASASVGGQVQSYTYDSMNRLDTAKTTGGNIPGFDLDYGYSGTNGNLASVRNSGTTTYSYTDGAHPHAATGLSDGYTYEYDLNGNMTKRMPPGANNDYYQTWTIENRLEQVKWPQEQNSDNVTTFVYDGDGNRTLKIEKYKDVFGVMREVVTVYIAGLCEVDLNTTSQMVTNIFASSQP